jgi:hypothetical protein
MFFHYPQQQIGGNRNATEPHKVNSCPANNAKMMGYAIIFLILLWILGIFISFPLFAYPELRLAGTSKTFGYFSG